MSKSFHEYIHDHQNFSDSDAEEFIPIAAEYMQNTAKLTSHEAECFGRCFNKLADEHAKNCWSRVCNGSVDNDILIANAKIIHPFIIEHMYKALTGMTLAEANESPQTPGSKGCTTGK